MLWYYPPPIHTYGALMSNHFLWNPISGSRSFGFIQSAKVGQTDIPSGLIRLEPGNHWGPHKGFGAKHIWAEHQSDMKKAGFLSDDQVSAYVAGIVCVQATLFFEGGDLTGRKVTAVKSTKGIGILGYRENAGYWRIVTVYGRKQASGTRFGVIQPEAAAHG